MTVNELIKKLERIREFEGGEREIVLTAAYGSVGEIDSLEVDLKRPVCYLHTNIMTG